ncbi:MAG: VanZ family protein [Solirubrobacterales bacterium]
MNKKIKWVLLFAWMIIIFAFSNQPAVISDEKSKFIIKLFEILGLNLNSMLGDMANFAVRKTAHFLEYFMLCVFAFNAVYEERNLKRTVIISIIIVFLYACSDEFHQLFIPGRASRFTDVIIDTTGGSIASLTLYFRQIKKLKRVKS